MVGCLGGCVDRRMTKKQVTTLLDEARTARRANLAQRKLQTEKLALTTKLEKRMAGIIALETEAEREKRRSGKHDFIVVGGMLSAAKDQLHYVDTLDWDHFLDDDDLVRRCAELAGVTGRELLEFVCSKCNPSNLRATQQAWQKWFFREQLKNSLSSQTIVKLFLEYKSELKKMHTQELETAKQQSYATGKKDFHRKGALVVNTNSAKKIRSRIDWYKLNFKTTPSINSKRKGQIATVSEMIQTLADKFNVGTDTAGKNVQSARRELRQEGVIR